jgi:hypothetical protein
LPSLSGPVIYQGRFHSVPILPGSPGSAAAAAAVVPSVGPSLHPYCSEPDLLVACAAKGMLSCRVSRSFALNVGEHGHEAEVHMQLLVAVKQGEAGIVGNEIDLGFLVSAYHHHIFDHAGGGQSRDPG